MMAPYTNCEMQGIGRVTRATLDLTSCVAGQRWCDSDGISKRSYSSHIESSHKGLAGRVDLSFKLYGTMTLTPEWLHSLPLSAAVLSAAFLPRKTPGRCRALSPCKLSGTAASSSTGPGSSQHYPWIIINDVTGTDPHDMPGTGLYYSSTKSGIWSGRAPRTSLGQILLEQ